MENYLVAIIEEDSRIVQKESLLKVEAPNSAHAMHKAVALYYDIDIDKVDLDLDCDDISIHIFREKEIIDHTV